MSESGAKAVSPDPLASTKSDVKTRGAGLDVSTSSSGLMEVNKPTVRTHTVVIDATSSTSTDVGVQATPVAVSAELKIPQQKQEKGILHVTSDMRNSATNDSRNQIDNHTSATNTKEKTPMCLVNELARFNKVAHKYVLVDEKGPAHKKEFKIRLDLGTEVYLASGSSIKRAQHAAAEVALNSTKLNRPAVKPPKIEPPTVMTEKKKTGVVTPTVELNALAMRLGERAEYISTETHIQAHNAHMTHNYLYHPVQDYYHHHHYRMPHMYPSPFIAPIRHRMPVPFTVILRIGQHEFRGQGATRQLARHNAASKALKVLSNIPFQREAASPSPVNEQQEVVTSATSSSSDSPDLTKEVDTVEPAPLSPALSSTSDSTGNSKSEISQVHEMALRLGKTIAFEVIHESGPPHMRNFLTRCICGDMTSEGEGNSKKKSKKEAADSMLLKLQALDQPTLVSKQRVKNVANKKKNRNLIKMQKANVEYGSGINPISRLIQIQQANKRREPVYSLVMEHGLPRKREFIIQVECNEKTCQGKGPNKKLAKRNAAEEMLQLMGYCELSPIPGKSVLKSPDHSGNFTSHHNKHVTFLDTGHTNKLPGVIVRKDYHGDTLHQEMPPFKADLAASLAKELLQKGKSVVGETLLPAKEHPKSPLKRPREQLEYLGSCMGFAIEFTDFPKGTNSKTCLTVVSLQTNPAQVFHGAGPTVDDSHDKAALQALKKLAQSAPDDDSVDETTPPVSFTEIKSEVVDEAREDCKARGDSVIPTANGQLALELNKESKSAAQAISDDTVTPPSPVKI